MIGLCSDIHSNKPALQAVLNDMEDQGVSVKVCLGDIVGYNPWPRECVEIVQENFDIIVQGNHDRNVRNPDRYRTNEMAHQGLLHSKSQLTTSQINWLEQLPLQSTIDSANLLAVHEHPDETKIGTRDAYVMPKDFPRIISDIDDEYAGVVLGHTHIAHSMHLNGYFVHNPGSVGQPRDNTVGASYSIIDPSGDTISYTQQTIKYDIDSVVQKCVDVGLPRKTGERLYNGE